MLNHECILAYQMTRYVKGNDQLTADLVRLFTYPNIEVIDVQMKANLLKMKFQVCGGDAQTLEWAGDQWMVTDPDGQITTHTLMRGVIKFVDP